VHILTHLPQSKNLVVVITACYALNSAFFCTSSTFLKSPVEIASFSRKSYQLLPKTNANCGSWANMNDVLQEH
jgi:hypothetical protein